VEGPARPGVVAIPQLISNINAIGTTVSSMFNNIFTSPSSQMTGSGTSTILSENLQYGIIADAGGAFTGGSTAILKFNGSAGAFASTDSIVTLSGASITSNAQATNIGSSTYPTIFAGGVVADETAVVNVSSSIFSGNANGGWSDAVAQRGAVIDTRSSSASSSSPAFNTVGNDNSYVAH